MAPRPCSLQRAVLSEISLIPHKNPTEPSLGRGRKRGSEALSDLPEAPPQILLQCSSSHITGREAKPASQSWSPGKGPRERAGMGRACWGNYSEFFILVLYTYACRKAPHKL